MIQNILIRIRSIAGTTYAPVVLLIIMGLFTGYFITDDFGISFDEEVHHIYAGQIQDIYSGILDPDDTISNLRYYGPVFNLLTELGAGLLTRLRPSLAIYDARHFMYYLSFLLAALAVYDMSLRFSGKWAAFLTAALFFTQPMLFGHAFINPKDIPFMGFFLASVAAGFRAVDHAASSLRKKDSTSQAVPHHRKPAPGHILKLIQKHSLKAAALVLITAAGLFTALDLLFFHLFEAFAVNQVSASYQGTAGTLIQNLFNLAASDAYKTPLDAYLLKIHTAFSLLRWLTIFTLYFLTIHLTIRSILPGKKSLPRQLLLILAVIALGFVTSMRVFGLFAGALVSLYALLRMKMRGILPLLFYWISALVFTYLTWPYLWKAPFSRLYESLTLMSSFEWDGPILYAGRIIAASNRPWHYAPWLLTIQLTLPAVLLGVTGILRIFLKPSLVIRKPELLLLLAWFAIPMAGSFLPSSRLYDNIRHLLFIIPPLFILGAPVLHYLISRLPSWRWKALIVAVLALPAVPDLMMLHPYQYVYYNEFVGKTRGAYLNYELDYWQTSSREAMEYINELAPLNAVVGFPKDYRLFEPFARDDIVLSQLRSTGEPRSPDIEYTIRRLRARGFLDQDYQDRIIWSVERLGVPLIHVLKY